MKPRVIRPGVHWLGAVDWNRRLFDALIPLPDGTSYNAYLVRGTRGTALMDTVDPTKVEALLWQLREVERLDYIVAHHGEQDHSGAIPAVLARYPQARVLATAQGKDLIVDHLHVPAAQIDVVADGETLSLGEKTLEFIHTPWVHWPETMVTYLAEDRLLFSCDFFGSHLATTDLYVRDEAQVYEAAKRYFAEIMMPFRRIIQRNLQKVEAKPVECIAPSHGPIYPEPEFIMGAYRDWCSDQVHNQAVIAYTSMHGSTARMAEYLVSALGARGVTVQPFDLAVTDIGKLAIALVDAATLVVGTPTVHAGPHPLVVNATYLANALRPKVRFASVIGSYGWNTKAVEQIAAMIPNLRVEVLEPVLCRGLPREADYAALDRLAEVIVTKHREAGLTS